MLPHLAHVALDEKTTSIVGVEIRSASGRRGMAVLRVAVASGVRRARVFLVAANAASYLLLFDNVLIGVVSGIRSVIVFIVLTPLAAPRWWL